MDGGGVGVLFFSIKHGSSTWLTNLNTLPKNLSSATELREKHAKNQSVTTTSTRRTLRDVCVLDKRFLFAPNISPLMQGLL